MLGPGLDLYAVTQILPRDAWENCAAPFSRNVYRGHRVKDRTVRSSRAYFVPVVVNSTANLAPKT